MGFSWRKSVGIGPLRLNFSRSGLGASIGVRGARISAGPRGTYVHLGAGGFRYSQRLGEAGGRTPAPGPPSPPRPRPIPPLAPGRPSGAGASRRIETIEAGAVQPSTADDLLAEIRARSQAGSRALLSVMVAIVGVGLGSLTAAASGPAGTLAAFRLVSATGFAIGVLGLLALPWAAWSDRVQRTVRIAYVLDPLGQQIEDALQRLFGALETASALWSVRSELDHGDAKRHAGATVSVDRHRVGAGLGAPPSVRTNVAVGRLEIGRRILHFFPDRILVYGGPEITAIDYDSLRISSHEVRFVEAASVPPDATVVGETWRYVNKDGSPDRRFASNQRLPVVLYGVLEVDAGPGLKLALQTSQAPLAGGAAQILRLIAQASRQVRSGRTTAPVRVQTSDPTVWDDDPPPLAGLARSLGSGLETVTRGLSLRWAHRLPDWLQPMVWGVALSVPLLVVGLRLLRPAAMPLLPLAALLALSLVAGVGLLRQAPESD